jgi:AcrR family transcriptional regulator
MARSSKPAGQSSDLQSPRVRQIREKLLDSAEKLLAQNGIEAVSLRQVVIDARQRNKSAVNFYIGNKDDLIVAVFRRRVEELNIRRKAMIARAEAQGTLKQVRTQLEILLRPPAEVAGVGGPHSYARFLHQLQLQGLPRSIFRLLPPEVTSPVLQTIATLRSLLPDLPDAVFAHRMDCALSFFLSAVSMRSLQVTNGAPVLPLEEFLDDLFRMVTAAVQAPANAINPPMTENVHALTDRPGQVNGPLPRKRTRA